MIFREDDAISEVDSGGHRHFALPAMLNAATVSPSLPIAVAELVAHRSYLVRFALRKLRDPALAEDAVHDVIEAVLSGRARFAGRSALRSWLTAILKHKIVDVLRRGSHHESLDADFGDGDGEHTSRDVRCDRPGPEEIAARREELAHALAGIERLPPTLREAIVLRVVEEQPTAEVCAKLGISEENLFVRVHRARRQLLS